jgi:hypothetical protein
MSEALVAGQTKLATLPICPRAPQAVANSCIFSQSEGEAGSPIQVLTGVEFGESVGVESGDTAVVSGIIVAAMARVTAGASVEASFGFSGDTAGVSTDESVGFESKEATCISVEEFESG